MKFYQIADVQGGEINRNEELHNHLVENLFDGRYLISYLRLSPKSTIKDYRRCYFLKIDTIAAEVGDTRYGIHELVKEYIMEDMMQKTPELFQDEEISTKSLSLEGWIVLLERLDIWAFVEYNIVLQ